MTRLSSTEGGRIATETVNPSERFVYDVCRKSFLSLWSYANPRGRNGKELCDILIVCDPHVIVVSVKNVKLKIYGDAELNRERWLRKAVEDSKRQIMGAIRFLNRADQVVKMDGTTGVPLPPLERRVYHRIAVAFGARRATPILIDPDNQSGDLFHILDEQSFYLLLRHLDTISDFAQYLSDKEALLSRTTVVIQGGEENLLATYLHSGRKFPENMDMLILQEDLWEGISSKPEFTAKLELDKDGYIWDHLIESFCVGGFDGETWDGPGLSNSEISLRVMAREDRFARRSLGKFFRDFLELSKSRKIKSRLLVSPSGVGYVFFAYDSDYTHEQRQHELLGRCFASLNRIAECSTIIGININVPGATPREGFSTDLVMLHREQDKWPQEDLEMAELLKNELGYFKNPIETSQHEDEYPTSK